jgi:hypothetical protein
MSLRAGDFLTRVARSARSASEIPLHAPLPVEQLKGVPQPLVILLGVLLEKEPARRFQNPAELSEVMPLVREPSTRGVACADQEERASAGIE